jgi:polyhydroxyalkanoate synthesis regulator phasin
LILAISENFKCKIKEMAYDNTNHEENNKDIDSLEEQIEELKE